MIFKFKWKIWYRYNSINNLANEWFMFTLFEWRRLRFHRKISQMELHFELSGTTLLSPARFLQPTCQTAPCPANVYSSFDPLGNEIKNYLLECNNMVPVLMYIAMQEHGTSSDEHWNTITWNQYLMYISRSNVQKCWIITSHKFCVKLKTEFYRQINWNWTVSTFVTVSTVRCVLRVEQILYTYLLKMIFYAGIKLQCTNVVHCHLR